MAIRLSILAYVTILFPVVTRGQINLVPNFSFEDTVQCPLVGTDITSALGWMNWGITPDYYNACANGVFPAHGVPFGLYSGFQYALDGSAYAGIVTFQDQQVEHEFIAVQLTQPLVIGKKYYVSAYIVLGIFGCAANKFGFKFFNAPSYSVLNPPPINNFCQVYSDSIIADSINWTRVGGSFIADSAYEYLAVGNFHDNLNTDTLQCSPPGTGAYYLVDAVCVSDDSLACMNYSTVPLHGGDILLLFPNPASDRIVLNPSSKKRHVAVYSGVGRLVMEITLNVGAQEFDISGLSTGLYFVDVDNQLHYKLMKN